MVFKDVNPASSVLLGYSNEELLQMSLFSLLNTENKLMIKQELDEHGLLNDREIELFTKSREKKVCIISVSREKESTGGEYLQGIIHDITNLKKAEKVTLQIEKLGATAAWCAAGTRGKKSAEQHPAGAGPDRAHHARPAAVPGYHCPQQPAHRALIRSCWIRRGPRKSCSRKSAAGNYQCQHSGGAGPD